ncbi:MAG: diguanylate cyclase [Hydrogenovibrio sp.]|nr:diguanylate cyclase [Hydrogenovibrio sp.]
MTADPSFPSLETQFEHLADAVYLIDPETSNIIGCNRTAYEDLGFTREEILNHSVLSLQKDVQGMPQWQEVVQVIRNNTPYTFVGRHIHKNGGEIAVEVVTSCFEENGKDYFLSVARNINKRLALEKDMFTQNQHVWFALNEASDGIWEWEIDTGYVFFSPQLKRTLGYGPDEMKPDISTWSENIHPDDLSRVMRTLDEHLKGFRVTYEAEYRLKNRNGHYIWVKDKGKVCERDTEGNPTHAVGMVQNITDHKQLQFQLESLAADDVLTNLPNRREGEKTVLRELAISQRTGHPLCLAIIDLDHFKQINDVYGHQKGDDTLIFCADLLRSTLRSSDYIYRWGGEEFIALFINTNEDQAEFIMEKLHRAFRQADWASLGIPPITFSSGVAAYPTFEAVFETMVKHADNAVYLAKEQGRNRTLFAKDTLID